MHVPLRMHIHACVYICVDVAFCASMRQNTNIVQHTSSTQRRTTQYHHNAIQHNTATHCNVEQCVTVMCLDVSVACVCQRDATAHGASQCSMHRDNTLQHTMQPYHEHSTTQPNTTQHNH